MSVDGVNFCEWHKPSYNKLYYHLNYSSTLHYWSNHHSRDEKYYYGNSSCSRRERRKNVENILRNSRKVFKPRERKGRKKIPSHLSRGMRKIVENGVEGKIFSINYHFFLGVWMNVRIIKLPFALPFSTHSHFLRTPKTWSRLLLKTNQICKTTFNPPFSYIFYELLSIFFYFYALLKMSLTHSITLPCIEFKNEKLFWNLH